MNKSKEIVDKVLLSVTSFMLVLMVLLSIWQVTARYLLNVASPGTEEAIRFLLIWYGLLSAAYVFGIKKHIAILFFREKLGLKTQSLLEKFTNVLIILTAGVLMVYGGIQIMLLTTTQIAPATGISQAIVYASLPISGLFVIFYTIHSMMAGYENTGEEVESL
ncbi:TRAP transporter small permease [Virgibacillus ainsalahensis]